MKRGYAAWFDERLKFLSNIRIYSTTISLFHMQGNKTSLNRRRSVAA
jgi:hypothetical protein